MVIARKKKTLPSHHSWKITNGEEMANFWPKMAENATIGWTQQNTSGVTTPYTKLVSQWCWLHSKMAKDTQCSLQKLLKMHYKKNQMGNRNLNSEAENGNWWQPSNHKRKILIAPEQTFLSRIQPGTPSTPSKACLSPVQSSTIQYSPVRSRTAQYKLELWNRKV